MKLKTIFLLIVINILLLMNAVSAQTLQIGFGLNPIISGKTIKHGPQDGALGFFAYAGIKKNKMAFLKDLIAEIRLGGTIESDYLQGHDTEFALKSHVLTKSTYLVLGIDLRYTMAQGHNSSAVYSTEITSFNAGMGFNLPGNVFIELSRSFPLSNPALGYVYTYDSSGNQTKALYRLKYLYVIDIGIFFDINL